VRCSGKEERKVGAEKGPGSSTVRETVQLVLNGKGPWTLDTWGCGSSCCFPGSLFIVCSALVKMRRGRDSLALLKRLGDKAYLLSKVLRFTV
jgi:hypothetical protein